MPPKVTAADQRLLDAYQEAALRLARVFQAVATPRDRKRALGQVDAILAQLDELSALYVREQVPIHYKAGSEEAISQLRRLSGFGQVDATFSTIHTEAVQHLAEDATTRFASALEGVRRSADSAIRQATKQEIVNKLMQNEIEGASNPRVDTQQILEDAGIVAIQSGNRGWSLEDYSSMLTHTLLAEAHNTGAMNRYVSNGVEYAQVIERPDAPDRTCQWMRDKIVWLGDQRLINPYHPNCMGGIKPFVGDPQDPIRSIDDPRIPVAVRAMLAKR